MCRTSIFNGTNTNRSMAIVFEAFLFSLHVTLSLSLSLSHSIRLLFGIQSIFSMHTQQSTEWMVNTTVNRHQKIKVRPKKMASNASRRQKRREYSRRFLFFPAPPSDEHSLTHIYCVYCVGTSTLTEQAWRNRLITKNSVPGERRYQPTRKSRRRSSYVT